MDLLRNQPTELGELRSQIVAILSKFDFDKLFNELSNEYISDLIRFYLLPNKDKLTSFESAKTLLPSNYRIPIDHLFSIEDQQTLFQILLKWMDEMKS